MLDFLRKNRQSTLLKLLLAAIAIVFIFLYVGVSGLSELEVAARVDDYIISKKDYDRTYLALSNTYRSSSPNSPPPELIGAQALNQLITAHLLTEEAERLGLMVDKQELRDSITAMPAFHVDGQFSKNAYVEVIRLNRTTPREFEQGQAQQLLASKLLELIRTGVHVTEEEVAQRFRHENERVTVRFVRIPASDFRDNVTISEEDLQTFFAAEKESFREPERIRIRYVEFRPEDFAAQVKPTDKEIQVYYDAHLDEYRRPEEVRARHILFQLAPEASPEDRMAVRERATAVLERAKGGEDFAALAKEYSEDSTADAGGDLGFFGRGVMEPAFEAVAFGLAPGQISELVETQSGIHIIRVEEKLAERVEPLDAVRDDIVPKIQASRGRHQALKRVEEAHDRLLEGQGLDAVAGAFELSVVTTPPFARGESIVGLGKQTELIDEAFAVETGEVGEIVTLESGYVVFEVSERIPSFVPELDAVRDKVEAKLRDQRAAQAATARAEELLRKLKEKPDLDALAKEEHLTVEKSGEIGRFGNYVPKLGVAPQLKEAAFRLTTEAPIAPATYAVNGDAIIAVLHEHLPPDESRFESEKAALAERIRQRLEAAAVEQFIDHLRGKAQIEIAQGYGAGTALQ